MRYLPHTQEDIRRMLEQIGTQDLEELFASIPAESRIRGPLALPEALDEASLRRHLAGLAARNRTLSEGASFLGCGAYDHVVPAAVDAVISRGEFFTAYTPYQPEVSQGTLQALFEFQTMVAELFGLDVANASMYDAASATAEAVLMARRIHRGRRRKVVLSRGLHPEYLETCRTYLSGVEGLEVVEVGLDETGRTDGQALSDALDGETICLVAQSPNFLGVCEDWASLSDAAHRDKALMVGVVGELTSLGLLEAPGRLGCDMVVGDGLGLAGSLSAGGPGVGLMACRDTYKRNLPGRLVGRTVDREGREGYVLTLAAREQHIRREKATSNICTNHSLVALALTVHLSLLGRRGLAELARQNYSRARYVRKALEAKGLVAHAASPHYNEFAVRLPKAAAAARHIQEKWGLRPGVALGRFDAGYEDLLLVCVTERHSKKDLDRLVSALTWAAGA